jgi:hypothetical protein
VRGATPLIDQLQSYSSPSEVQQALRVDSNAWHIVERTIIPKSGGPAKYKSEMVRLEDFTHLDIHGELILDFFNDRLMGAVFYPSDASLYRRKLEETRGIKFHIVPDRFQGDLPPREETSIPPRTRIWIGKDYKGKTCFGWEDRKLAREHDRWLAHND